MTGFDRTVKALRQYGLTDNEILRTLSQLCKELMGVDIGFRTISYQEKTMEERIEVILQRIGISKKLSGYGYLVRVANLYIEDPRNINKILYPMVAEEFHTTTKAVERDIRYAIHSSWEKCSTQTKEEVFGDSNIIYLNKAPSTSQFMSLMKKTLSPQHD